MIVLFPASQKWESQKANGEFWLQQCFRFSSHLFPMWKDLQVDRKQDAGEVFEEKITTRSLVLFWITILSEQYWTDYIIDPFFYQHFRLKHRESSSPTKMLPCNECDKHYGSTTSLKQHVRQKHKNYSGRVPGYFPCPNCGKIYSYIAGLWQHTKSIHGIKS